MILSPFLCTTPKSSIITATKRPRPKNIRTRYFRFSAADIRDSNALASSRLSPREIDRFINGNLQHCPFIDSTWRTEPQYSEEETITLQKPPLPPKFAPDSESTFELIEDSTLSSLVVDSSSPYPTKIKSIVFRLMGF